MDGIAALLAARSRTKDELISQGVVFQDGAYEATSGTSMGKKDGIFYYFKGDSLLLAYMSKLDIRPGVLLARFGNGSVLRSRAGKLFKQHVYPEQGFAFSTDGETVCILEAFPPTTLGRYKKTLWKDPGEFIR